VKVARAAICQARAAPGQDFRGREPGLAPAGSSARFMCDPLARRG